MTKWGDGQTKYVTRVVKEHDRELYAERSHLGHINVYRKNKRFNPVCDFEGVLCYSVVSSPDYVFSLTDTWTANGSPVDWGGEVVLARLKKHDLHTNEMLFKELDDGMQKVEKSKERDFNNKTEAWLADNHSKFKKAWSDVRVANLDKSEKRRRLHDKRIKEN